MSIATTLLEKASLKHPQLAHLTVQLDDLRVRGTYFKLRVLDEPATWGKGIPRLT